MDFEQLRLPTMAEGDLGIKKMAALIKNTLFIHSSNGSLNEFGSVSAPKAAISNPTGETLAEKRMRLLGGLRVTNRTKRRGKSKSNGL